MRDELKKTDTRIGSILEDRYRILKKIATGGMSVVYAGERVQLGRPVAVKFLHPKLSEDEKFLKRFELEARAMSQLSHPNCISVIDFGIADAPYLVMELVTGKTLKKVLKNGPMEPIRLMMIIRQILAGLSHAHKQGIIHRDIKPGNILLTEADCSGEHVLVFDFGLAKHLDLEGEDLTGKGIVAGTAEYLAPENTGRNGGKITLDERTDLFSVGVVAYEMLTKKRPFVPPSPMEIWRMHDNPPLPLIKAYPEGKFSPAVEKIIAKALARDPAKRYQTAQEFVEAVDAYLEQEGHHSRSVPPPPPELASGDASSLTPVVSDHKIKKKPIFLLGVPMLVLALIGFGVGIFFGGGETDIATANNREGGPTQGMESTSAPPAPLPKPAKQQGGARGGNAAKASAEVAPNPSGKPAVQRGAADVDQDQGEKENAKQPRDIRTLKENDPEELAFLMYLIGNGEIGKAIQKLENLTTRFPEDSHLYLLLGNLYSQQKKEEEAFGSYKRSVKLHRANGRNRVLMGNMAQFLAINSIHNEVAGFIEYEIGPAAIPVLQKALNSTDRPKFQKRIKEVLKRLSQPD